MQAFLTRLSLFLVAYSACLAPTFGADDEFVLRFRREVVLEPECITEAAERVREKDFVQDLLLTLRIGVPRLIWPTHKVAELYPQLPLRACAAVIRDGRAVAMTRWAWTESKSAGAYCTLAIASKSGRRVIPAGSVLRGAFVADLRYGDLSGRRLELPFGSETLEVQCSRVENVPNPNGQPDARVTAVWPNEVPAAFELEVGERVTISKWLWKPGFYLGNFTIDEPGWVDDR